MSRPEDLLSLERAGEAMIRARLPHGESEHELAEAVARWLVAAHQWNVGRAFLWSIAAVRRVRLEREAA